MKLNDEKSSVKIERSAFTGTELDSVVQLKQNLIDTLEQYKALLDMQLLLKK